MIFDSLIAGCWIIFVFVWIISGLGAKKTIPGNILKRRFWINLLLFIVVILFCNRVLQKVSLADVHILPSSPFVQVAGVVICATGIAFAIWARIHLGKNWGMPMSQKEHPELITTGPYHLVRHPIYTGICFAMLGSSVTEGFPFFIGSVFVMGFFIYSAKREEKMMLDQFSDVYMEYRRHTKMIIPFIY